MFNYQFNVNVLFSTSKIMRIFISVSFFNLRSELRTVIKQFPSI